MPATAAPPVVIADKAWPNKPVFNLITRVYSIPRLVKDVDLQTAPPRFQVSIPVVRTCLVPCAPSELQASSSKCKCESGLAKSWQALPPVGRYFRYLDGDTRGVSCCYCIAQCRVVGIIASEWRSVNNDLIGTKLRTIPAPSAAIPRASLAPMD